MPESDADLLSAAASEAAKIAVHYWRTDQKVRDKGDGAGPVSEGDIAVDTYLRKTLTQARPDYGWLSEETPDNPERLSAKRVFIVDPIDGTRAYVDGQTTWAHSLAVVERGKTVAAVVHLPKLEKTYSAQLGGGALLNGEPIATSARTTADRAEVLASRQLVTAIHKHYYIFLRLRARPLRGRDGPSNVQIRILHPRKPPNRIKSGPKRCPVAREIAILSFA